MGEDTIDFLQSKTNSIPHIDLNKSIILLEKLYGLKIKKITELNSYEDKNYKVLTEENCDNKYISKICENGYVFKVLNKLSSKNANYVDAQNQMMIFLGKHNIKCSKPIQNKNGGYFTLEKIGNEYHIVRLLEFVPGELFFNVPPSAELFYNAGQYLGNIDVILKGFYHDAYKNHRSIWMPDSIPKIKQYLHVIKNKNDYQMITEIVYAFESKVLNQIDTLEKGFIHGDFNDQNVIVKQNKNGGWFVDAILDFGETHYTCLLFELSIALTYVIINGKSIDLAGHFLAGYSTKRSIPAHEYAFLKVCIAVRFCQSIVYGTYFASLNPENDYILSSQNGSMEMLRELWRQTDEKFITNYKNIVETY